MPRLPRFVLPGQPQHVIQRGNNRNAIFGRAEDYALYLEALGRACERFECDLHAYMLMPNHVHLLLTPRREGGIGKALQSLGRRYVQYFNSVHDRTGTLWEGRYRATLIDGERYLLSCMCYMELNPVRAGMAALPAEYPYSSYAGNALGKDDPLLTAHPSYEELGTSPGERRGAYRALFRAGLDEEVLRDIREATNKAWVLGDDAFRARIERLTERRAAPKPRGGDRRSEAYRQSTKTDRA